MDLYYVVEFNDGVQLVPSNWLTSDAKSCSFPKYEVNSKRYFKAVEDREEVQEGWKQYPVVKLMSRTDCYDTGRTQLRRAEYRSDIEQSTDYDDRSNRRVKYQDFYTPKRRRVDIVETSDDDVVETSFFTQRHPLPIAPVSSSGIQALPCLPSPILSSALTPPTSFKVSKEGQSGDKILLRKVTGLTLKMEKLEENQIKILEKLEEICTKLGSENLRYNSITDLPKFPLETVEELDELEEKLKDEKFKLHLIQELSKLGGKGLSHIISRQLQFLLANSLGNQFSYFGTKDKRAFCSLLLCTVLLDVARISYSQTTSEHIKEPIQTWLRHRKEKLVL